MSRNTLLSELYSSALAPMRDRPMSTLPRRLYSYVCKVSGRQQLRLCLLTVLLFPLTLAPLELQRRLINDAIGSAQTGLLFLLGGVYLAIVLLHGALKYVRNIYQQRVAEGVSRNLRRRIANAESFGAETDEGTKQSIISSEAERVGEFVGESIAFPLLQSGIVLSVAGYMLVVDPLVAAVALCFFVPSLATVAVFLPFLSRLSKRKTTTVRELAEDLLRTNGPGTGAADADGLIDRIYRLRLRISIVKYAMKTLNNVLGQLGPLSILMIGGWLAIHGKVDVGTIVAFLSGYERLVNPARDLLNFYRRLSVMRVQYGLVRAAG